MIWTVPKNSKKLPFFVPKSLIMKIFCLPTLFSSKITSSERLPRLHDSKAVSHYSVLFSSLPIGGKF